MASLCRTALVAGLVLVCLGCTAGLSPAPDDKSLSSGPAGSSRGALVGAPSQDKPMIDRMDRSTIKKALAYERPGEKSVVQQTAGASTGGSVVDSISSSFKQGVDKVGSMFTPAPTKENTDPISLSTKSNPGPDLYVKMARLNEGNGNLEEAERQYQHALKIAPDRLDALVGMGRLRDRQGELDEALKYYQKAIKAHPKEASAYNDLGLCYARNRKYPESIQALKRAVEMQPSKPMYRNNLATVLVESGDNDGAFTQLAVVHGEAGACYNLGYLVYKKGQYDLAAKLFAKALERDPSMTQAGLWLQQTQRAMGSSPPSVQGPGNVATNAPQLPSRMEQPGEAVISQPTGVIASPDGPRRSLPLLEARRSPPGSRPTRQLPPVTGSALSGETEAAPLPPMISSDEAAPAGSTPTQSNLARPSSQRQPLLTAPLPPVTR